MKSNVILVLLLAILALLLTGAWLAISERTKKRVMYYVPDAVFSEAGMEEPNHQIYVWLWVPEKRPKRWQSSALPGSSQKRKALRF